MTFLSPYCLTLVCSDKDIASYRNLMANDVDKYMILRIEGFRVVVWVYGF